MPWTSSGRRSPPRASEPSPLVTDGRIREAYAEVEALAPDLRIAIEPLLTARCLHAARHATANATLDLVRALSGGRDSVVGAQVQLSGEVSGIETVVGVPVIVNADGWAQVVCPPLVADEKRQLDRAARTIAANLAAWTSSAPSQAAPAQAGTAQGHPRMRGGRC